jgi:hypothetical protein
MKIVLDTNIVFLSGYSGCGTIFDCAKVSRKAFPASLACRNRPPGVILAGIVKSKFLKTIIR